MQINHNRVRQVLHAVTIVGFSIAVIIQLRNLYLYGGKPSKTLDGEDDVEDLKIKVYKDREDDLNEDYPDAEPLRQTITENERDR